MSEITFLHRHNERNLPWSRVAIAGDFLYTYGDGEEIREGSVKSDLRKPFERLKGLLAEQGLSFAHVVKVTALLSGMQHWEAYNAVYREFFSEPFPVRTTIPLNHSTPLLELDLVAYKEGLSARAKA